MVTNTAGRLRHNYEWRTKSAAATSHFNDHRRTKQNNQYFITYKERRNQYCLVSGKYQDKLCIFQRKRDSKETRTTTSTVRVTTNWRQLIIKTVKTSAIGRKKTKVRWDVTMRTTHVDDDDDR